MPPRRRQKPRPSKPTHPTHPPQDAKPSRTFKYDWKDYEGRFMAHEWADIKQMARTLGMHPGVAYGHTRGWHQRRQTMDDQALHQAEDKLIDDRATMIVDMNKRQLAIARRLQEKAARQLLRKHFDIETGEMVDNPFETDSLAVQALRLGASMEQGLLLRNIPGGDAQPGSMTFNGPAVLLGGGAGNLSAMQPDDIQRRLAEFTPEALQSFLQGPDDDNQGIEKTSGARTAEPTGRAKKH